MENNFQIDWIELSKLKPDPENTNRHPKDQIERLAKIIEYQGWRHPIIATKDNVIRAGEGRYLAAKKLKLKKVPVCYQDFKDDDQLRSFVTSDNAIASWAELDLAMINSQVGDFDPSFDIDLLGLKDFTIDIAERLEPQIDEDEVPEPAEPVCKPGDLWILGEHRLLCGDSTNIQHVERLMNGEKADMVFTSPPYNGNTAVGFKQNKPGGMKTKELYVNNNNDNKTEKEYLDFNTSIFGTFSVAVKDTAPIFYNVNYNKNSPSSYIKIVYNALEAFNLIETICWEKQMAISLAGNNLTRIFEFIFMFSKSDTVKMFKKNRNECVKNIWKISNIGANTKDHKACFPVYLVEYAANYYSDIKSLFYEPFGGSGSTLIACEKTNRKCFMMELDPHYCDVIVNRWEKYTGKKAVLDGQDQEKD